VASLPLLGDGDITPPSPWRNKGLDLGGGGEAARSDSGGFGGTRSGGGPSPSGGFEPSRRRALSLELSTGGPASSYGSAPWMGLAGPWMGSLGLSTGFHSFCFFI
jgi:hypothetical protein